MWLPSFIFMLWEVLPIEDFSGTHSCNPQFEKLWSKEWIDDEGLLLNRSFAFDLESEVLHLCSLATNYLKHVGIAANLPASPYWFVIFWTPVWCWLLIVFLCRKFLLFTFTVVRFWLNVHDIKTISWACFIGFPWRFTLCFTSYTRFVVL